MVSKHNSNSFLPSTMIVGQRLRQLATQQPLFNHYTRSTLYILSWISACICSFFKCQPVGQIIRPFSWGKRHRVAHWLECQPLFQCQHSRFALFCHFVGILRLVKDSDLIVKHDDGKDRNFFNLSEPKNAALVSAVSRSMGDLPPANACPCTSGERYECVPVVFSQEPTGAEFMGVRPVLCCGTYEYMAVD